MDHKIRPATPADCREIATLVYIAGQGHTAKSAYDLMIDGPPGMTEERLDVLEKLAAARTVSWFSYVYYSVIEVAGQVACGLATFTVEQYEGTLVGKALMEAGWSVRDVLSMAERMNVWVEIEPGRVDGYLIVENVATLGPHRRKGMTAALLDEAVRRGRAEGFKGLQLEAMLGNEPALAAYEKAGFRQDRVVVSERFEQCFPGSSGVVRMLLDF